VRIGTRASALARAQTEQVVARLRRLYPDLDVEIVPISTSGDRSQASNVPGPGWGTGVFVRELESALARGEIDAAVHSLKDLPPELAPGLTIAAVPSRADPRDTLITRAGIAFVDLPQGALVGTSSARRSAFLTAARPELRFAPVRGNVETRLRKLLAGEYDALVLARAGLERLGLQVHEVPLDEALLLPAPGQGALAVECRADDAETRRRLAPLHDVEIGAAVAAERRAMAELEGGCRLPVAALGRAVGGGQLSLEIAVAAPDGSRVLRAAGQGRLDEPDQLARRLAAELRAQGADELTGLVTAP
jgi:hydroxymethylbilane synthase